MKGSEDHYRLITESLEEAVSLQDPQGRLVYANPALLRLTGLGAEGLLGREPDALAHPEDRERLRQAAPGPGEVTEVEWRCRRPDGSYRWLSTVSKVLDAAGGGTFQVLSSSRDVTERNAAEAVRNREAKTEAVALLAGAVAHDFNNLLTVIAGYSALLLESCGPGGEAHRALCEIQRAADRGAGLTRQLLAFSCPQSARPAALDLNALLRDLEPTLRGLLGPSVHLSLSLEPALRGLWADPGQIRQAVLNLAANAREAMPGGGHFTLATANAGPGVRLTVRDTGPGLDPAALAHVFEPFSLNREAGLGPGLGMATVYRIVRQGGGRIEAASAPGRGTEFTLDLPAAPRGGGERAKGSGERPEGVGERCRSPHPLAPHPTAPTPLGPAPAGGGETVLVVDDEPPVRSVARQVLEEQGYTVLEAGSGREALRVFDQHPGPVHLLLTDVLMPGLSGPELARRLREKFPGLRVLFMSGYSPEDVLPPQSGPEKMPFLAKPFRLPDLVRMAREALDAPAPPDAPALSRAGKNSVRISSAGPTINRERFRPRTRVEEGTVRLTLRTLLAYLDDTLEPTEIKQIGQKVAESDAAQELIARIKQITRRRRLTTPPATGPGARFDANTVAEYLDNELSSEQVAELEKTCLESDVHLAEIAACHQILTLVLGEPALVPPTAKERMYGLVQGREAIPFRKATATTTAPASANGADAEADEMFLLGLPFYRRRGTWVRWALPLAGLLLLVGLGVALWQAIPREPKQVAVVPNPPPAPDKNPDKKKPEQGKGAEGAGPEKKNGSSQPDQKNPPSAGKATENGGPTPGNRPPEDGGGVIKPVIKPTQAPAGPPSTAREKAGIFADPRPGEYSVLVHRKAGSGPWRRLPRGGKPVYTSDSLVSLPGYASQLKLDSGVWLLLRGELPEFVYVPGLPPLLESAVVLHKNPALDLDLTLNRGRVYISNHKDGGNASVRLRFGENEVWDLTLEEPGTELLCDLFRACPPDPDPKEEPPARLYLVVLKGKAGLKYDTYHSVSLSAPPGPALFQWDNKGSGAQGPTSVKEASPLWDKAPPSFKNVPPMKDAPHPQERADAAVVALEKLANQIVDDKSVGIALEEAIAGGPAEGPAAKSEKEGRSRLLEEMTQHSLAIYAMGAVDEVKQLVEILGGRDGRRIADRMAAIMALRHWLSRGPGQGRVLYDKDDKGAQSGLLLDLRYSPKQAASFVELLYGIKAKLRREPDTFRYLANLLTSSKTALAELAWVNLNELSAGAKLPFFSVALPQDKQKEVADKILDMVEKGELPPPPQEQPGQPGAEPEPRKPSSGGIRAVPGRPSSEG